MKATTIRPKKRMNPEFSKDAYTAAKKERRPYNVKPTEAIPIGTVLDHPEAWMLVKLGDAVPADEECREAANMSDDELINAIAKQELFTQGRATGKPEYDAARKPSSVKLPEEWSHLTEKVEAKIEELQRRIDSKHRDAKQAEDEEKAAERTMFVIDATDLPPEEDDLPED